MGRAFRRRAADRLADARTDFEAVAKRTGSFEAVVGAIDLRLRAGEPHAAIRAEYAAKRSESNAAQVDFVTAYLLSRQLPKLDGEAHEQAAKQALAALTASWSELKKQCIGQALYGSILHQEYLLTGALESAERASTHYLVALELVGNNLRYRAMVLGQLGLLHTQVGNYRIALGYLDARDRLPYAENSEGLAVRLAMARSQLHVGKEKEAATSADEALAMIDGAPRLAGYRLLALDRAALYNLAAHRFTRALELYDAELPLLETDQSAGGQRNRFVVRLARSAAALGADQSARAMRDLDELERGLTNPQLTAKLGWPHATNEQVVRSYRLILSGLRARALERLGQKAAAARALETRRSLLQTGLAAADRGEYVRMLMLVEAQLAGNAADRRDPKHASETIRKALEHADNLHDRAKGTIDTDQLDVLLLAAQMSSTGDGPPPAEIAGRLAKINDELNAHPSPSLRTYQRWFEIYLTLTTPITERGTAPRPDGETTK